MSESGHLTDSRATPRADAARTALEGTLLEQLGERGFRRVLARLQEEALAALAAAGIRPARTTPLALRWLPRLLRPAPLFRLLARRMLTIHPQARLSMYDDRVHGRVTEVDDLCGAVQWLAAGRAWRTSAGQSRGAGPDRTVAGRTPLQHRRAADGDRRISLHTAPSSPLRTRLCADRPTGYGACP